MHRRYIVNDEQMAEAKALIRQNDGTFGSSEFCVQGVKGTYALEGDRLSIHITDKPFFATESVISRKLDEFFG